MAFFTRARLRALALASLSVAGVVGWFEACGGRAPVLPSVPAASTSEATAREAGVGTGAPVEGGVESVRREAFPGPAIDAAVAKAIAGGMVPGAVIVVGRRDGVLFRRAYGFRELLPDRVPMTEDTLFDLASVTKPIATATSLMVLVERGAVALDDRLARYVPECGKNGKEAITLRQLLLHVSGLPSDIAKADFAHGRDEAIRRICSTALRGPPGATSIYSDLGFILLEEVIRRVTSRELPAFAGEAVFGPLGMKDTMFQPPDAMKARAAWTEFVDGAWRVGVVHDPRAYLLGGVAGHAGLFSTGDDLATYARAILGGGEVDGRRVLSARTVAAMIAPYDVPKGVRALGWNVDSSWRGRGLSPRAIGHFGFTGTALWIDPEKDVFTVVLTNRVHPDGRGDAKPLVAAVNTLVAEAVGPAVGRVDACVEGTGAVEAGIDVLRGERFERLRGRRVGLITNASGRARDGTSTVDLLMRADGVHLAALFTPEHGLGADQQGRIPSGHDERTGLPVFSLYGETFAPKAETLAGIDTLVFDIQDVGTRFFTYASTMRRAMEAARDHDLRFVVLDRPNPIDGVDVAGPVRMPASGSFVNFHPMAIRHGMTIGELATMFDADDHLGVDLSVVPVRGWRRALYGDETGLPWADPSPNLRSVGEALLYPAVGLLEATNLSVGRGTDAPFERVGAPWIDGAALAGAVAAENLPGIAMTAETFTPASEPYAHQACHGLHFVVVDRTRFEPVRTGLAIARTLHRLYPRAWDFPKLDRLLAHPPAMRALEAGLPLDEVMATYAAELAAFVAKREKYLLYGTGDCGAATPDAGADALDAPAIAR
ncbi:MAG TPA: exo-beta-N-acetylmuramidase NamZ domain-containing protein [Polyangiaceae bacterium]